MRPMDTRALFMWGRFRDFERDNIGDVSPRALFEELTMQMQGDIKRILPEVRQWLTDLEGATRVTTKCREIPAPTLTEIEHGNRLYDQAVQHSIDKTEEEIGSMNVPAFLEYRCKCDHEEYKPSGTYPTPQICKCGQEMKLETKLTKAQRQTLLDRQLGSEGMSA